MTTNLYSDNASDTTTTSPRISFSYDLPQSDTVPVEHLSRSSTSSSSSTVDFSFCICNISDVHQACMADELFLDGKILPIPMKSKTPSLSPPLDDEKSRYLAAEEEENLKRQSWRSFWGFKRSSSCGSGHGRGLCDPINVLLSRSRSMGSSASLKQTSSCSREGLDQKYEASVRKSSGFQKHSLRRRGYGYGNYGNVMSMGNVVRVSPVLNLGFGSLFYGNRKRKCKK